LHVEKPNLPRVLVVDDEPTNILIISGALKGEFQVVQATSGIEVLERVSAGDIDLVLLDIVMPGLDGFGVCDQLKKNPATSSVPVIFVTGLEDRDEETHGFSVGAVDYITKPIRPAIVRARVRTHVELKRSRDLLEQLASVDALTGVANRRRFDRTLDEEWRRSQRTEGWLSIAIADVDHFKRFNDRHGHIVGDLCLRSVAAALARSMRRAGDLVARYGGEEFGIILPNLDSAAMISVLQPLVRAVSNAQGPENGMPAGETITISVGAVSLVPRRNGTASDALSRADALLYEAKTGGRDRCVHLDVVTERKTVVTH
jgi:diguanylate cyclase (GGDEF)-like protein